MLPSSLRAALLENRYACVVGALAVGCAICLPGCCAAFDCSDYMEISGTISRPASASLRVDVLVCKSDACGNVLLTSDGIAFGDDAMSAKLDLEGSGSFECTLTRKREACTPGETCGGGGSWRLEMKLEGVDLEEGEEDVYEVVIVDTDTGETLVERTETVKYYDGSGDSAMCGRDCQSGDEIQFTTEPE